jgi:hypothetical protein
MSRPRTKVLLLMRNEVELSFWRLRLELCGRFAVLGTTEPMAALELAAEYPDCRVAATNIPDETGLGLLCLAPRLNALLLFGVKKVPATTLAHRVVLDDGTGCVDLVREALRGLSGRRRGPERRAVKLEGSATLLTLLEEMDVGRADPRGERRTFAAA